MLFHKKGYDYKVLLGNEKEHVVEQFLELLQKYNTRKLKASKREKK